MKMTLQVNGKDMPLDVDDDIPLLWVLRDHLGLTGTKFGCGVAQCGACTVYVDGEPRRACVTPATSVVGHAITTIEGEASKEMEALRARWIELDVPQCGYCQAGQLMTATRLIQLVKTPTDDDIDKAMSGNICRCATYARIRRAVKLAAHDVNGETP